MKLALHVPPMVVGNRHGAELVLALEEGPDVLRKPLSLLELVMLQEQVARLVQMQVAASVGSAPGRRRAKPCNKKGRSPLEENGPGTCDPSD